MKKLFGLLMTILLCSSYAYSAEYIRVGGRIIRRDDMDMTARYPAYRAGKEAEAAAEEVLLSARERVDRARRRLREVRQARRMGEEMWLMRKSGGRKSGGQGEIAKTMETIRQIEEELRQEEELQEQQ